jgi:hypothetical protein
MAPNFFLSPVPLPMLSLLRGGLVKSDSGPWRRALHQPQEVVPEAVQLARYLRQLRCAAETAPRLPKQRSTATLRSSCATRDAPFRRLRAHDNQRTDRVHRRRGASLSARMVRCSRNSEIT